MQVGYNSYGMHVCLFASCGRGMRGLAALMLAPGRVSIAQWSVSHVAATLVRLVRVCCIVAMTPHKFPTFGR